MKRILFDLDGTLTDPFLGITRSVAYSLKSFGIEVDDLETLKPFIGPPLDVSFREYYHMDEAQSWKAVEKYREYFSKKGLFENKVYEGMEDFLQSLLNMDMKLYVCTSKPEVFAKEILDHFSLTPYFTGIYGATLDGSLKNKGDVIAHCIKQEQLNIQDCMMVGDRQHDIVGAHQNQIPCIGVLYGYGSLEEFQEYHCDYIAKDLIELKKIIEEWKDVK
ncbi:phosphoglycolate phosphatase [Massilimicrobiota sp. An142]|jgi:phosphoglycolate phosphatase|uniref:HAD family hydrolase n=1 Tax=Massilimicrobiota timonensis TaxID=1776392 RepID=A0ABT7UJA1_9FIRM|nr:MULTISPECIES: HAD family hydrolase [Massilimicrobiota]MDM8196225.1 HAD family hydrolase [Massilimicrobiota timonensis]OUQ12291.1 phosphoglycolate phosphatase [Massilimicrobiota sp. An142]OUQ75885.1 phosphoglycolate phosphatase [Massilimicrobiota sp. An105]